MTVAGRVPESDTLRPYTDWLGDGLEAVRARLREGLSAPQVLACAAVLVVADWCYDRVGSSFVPGGPLDETAHIATALLILAALPLAIRGYAPIATLIGSFAIDVDHIPSYLGSDFLTGNTPRPYTHSLLTIVVLIAAGCVWRRRRRPLFGFALGMSIHLLRDLAEGSDVGASLLWPLSDRAFSYPHATYMLLIAGLVAFDCAKAVARRVDRERSVLDRVRR